MPYCALMRYYQPFPAAIPLDGPGYPHVTHPSATKYTQDSLYASTSIISAYTPFDLHVLGTPPAFILSQDRTLVFYLRISSMLLFFPSRTSLPVSGKGAVLPLSFFCVSLCPSFTAFWFKELSSLCFLSKLRCCLVFKVPCHLFSDFRRRRDLNPRAAINDLHPFQGCPFSHLGYFSIMTK